MSYRLSRVWSPIGHLNAVANSAAMREAYNECVPLLTAYSSELGQNEALYARYAHVLQHEGDAPRSRAAQAGRERAARFPPGGRRPARGPQEPLPRGGAAARAARARNSPRTCSMPARAYTRSVTDESELAGLPPNAVDRAAADAREIKQSGWLFKLDQPTYMTIMTSAESEQLRRDIYEAWVTRASELGPSARPLRQQSDHRRDPAAASRARAAPRIREFRRLRAGDAHGEEQQAGPGVPGRSGAALPPGGAAGVLGPRGIRGAQARCLGPRVLRRAAAGEPLQGLAGGAAAVFPAAQGAVRACSR